VDKTLQPTDGQAIGMALFGADERATQCPFCAARNSDEVIYCRFCGKRLTDGETARDGNRAGNKNTAWRLGIGLALGMTIALVTAVWFFVSRGASREGLVSAPQSRPAAAEPTSPMTAAPPLSPALDAASVANDKSLQLRPIPEGPSTAARAVQRAASEGSVRSARKEVGAMPIPQPQRQPVSQAATAPANVASPRATLATEFATCANLGLIAAAACKEKARWKYCQGKWGAIPDCPKPVDPSEGGG
jgi:hypothetical protein